MPTALTPAAGFWGIRDFCPALAGSASHTTLGHYWKEACRAGGVAVAAPLRCKNCLVLHCHILRPCPGVCLLLPVGCSSTCPVFGVLHLHPSAAGAMLPPPHTHRLLKPRLCWAAGLWGCVCVLRGGGQTRTGSVDGDEHPGVPHWGAGPGRSPHTLLPPVPPLPTWRPPHHPPHSLPCAPHSRWQLPALRPRPSCPLL